MLEPYIVEELRRREEEKRRRQEPTPLELPLPGAPRGAPRRERHGDDENGGGEGEQRGVIIIDL